MKTIVVGWLVMPLTASILLNLPTVFWGGRQTLNRYHQQRSFCCGDQSQDDDSKASRAEVVGKVLSNKCRLSPDKKEVLTLYEVSIAESREGELSAGANVTVAVRGGLVMFKADGSEVSESNRLDTDAAVEVEAPGESVPLEGVVATKHTPFDTTQIMENGVTYVLRLKMDLKWQTYVLTAPPGRVN